MILMYGFLRIARSVAIVGLDRREFIRPPSSLPQPCFCFSIPFHLFVYVHLVTQPVLSSRLEYDPGRGCSPFGRSESSGPQPHVLPPKRIQLFYLTLYWASEHWIVLRDSAFCGYIFIYVCVRGLLKGEIRREHSENRERDRRKERIGKEVEQKERV